MGANLRIGRSRIPSWVRSLNTFEWFEVAGSKCSTQLDSSINTFWTGLESGGNRENELNNARNPWNWSGTAFRNSGSIMLFHGGGGGDGRSNGVLGFVLNHATPYWLLAMPPTEKSKTHNEAATPFITTGYNVTFADKNVQSSPKTPTAMHSYTCCWYSNLDDRWLRYGCEQVWPSDGMPGDGTQLHVNGFNWSEVSKAYNDRAWSLSGVDSSLPASIPSGLSAQAVRTFTQHPTLEDILIGTGGQLTRWSRANNNWTTIYDGTYGTEPADSAAVGVDPVNNVAFVQRSTPVTVNLDNNTHGTSTLTGAAASEFSSASKPAQYVWDSVNQCLWALKAGQADTSFDLYKMVCSNKSTREWTITKNTTVAASGSTKPSWGTMGGNYSLYTRMKYAPELGGLVLSIFYDTPIWFIRTS